ncbi:MAG: hypothetical protein ABI024_15785 [Vicinamibacterales bacterium]
MNGGAPTDEKAFSPYPSRAVFRILYQTFLAEMCTEEARAVRAQEIAARLEHIPMSQFERSIRFGNLCAELRNHSKYFEQFKTHFFFCDLFPENVKRFADVTLEACLPPER